MRMLDPSPGEINDRVSILGLKIENGIKGNVSIRHFEEERDALISHLATQLSFSNTIDMKKFQELSTEAAQVNGKLWALEDEIRDLISVTQKDVVRIAEVAENIAHLNDRRSEIVRLTNVLFNIQGKEKMHVVKN